LIARAWSWASALVGYRYRARAVGLVSSACSAGRLKHSDFPEAVPVVTMNSPSIARLDGLGLVGVERLDPVRPQRREELGVAAAAARPVRAAVPPSKGLLHEALVGATLLEEVGSRAGWGGRRPPPQDATLRHGAAMPLSRLDGTLLGRGGSLLHDGEGRPSLSGARALEACLRANVEVVLMSGRRRGQLADTARLLGQTAYGLRGRRGPCRRRRDDRG